MQPDLCADLIKETTDRVTHARVSGYAHSRKGRLLRRRANAKSEDLDSDQQTPVTNIVPTKRSHRFCDRCGRFFIDAWNRSRLAPRAADSAFGVRRRRRAMDHHTTYVSLTFDGAKPCSSKMAISLVEPAMRKLEGTSMVECGPTSLPLPVALKKRPTCRPLT